MQAGASARERLRAAAAAQWKVSVEEIECNQAVLSHARTKRQATYGELASRAATIKLPAEPAPKPRERWTLLTQTNLADGARAIRRERQLGVRHRRSRAGHALRRVAAVPGARRQARSYDFDKIKGMPGVRGVAVVDPDEPRRELKKPAHWANTTAQSGIAVIAGHYWQARKALEALPVTWDFGAGAQWKNDQQIYDACMPRLKEPAEDLLSDSAMRRVYGRSRCHVVEANYLTPLCDHATMEPLNGTAW
jgi:isoquinoline 1-oxidoreductase beta subunit